MDDYKLKVVEEIAPRLLAEVRVSVTNDEAVRLSASNPISMGNFGGKGFALLTVDQARDVGQALLGAATTVATATSGGGS